MRFVIKRESIMEIEGVEDESEAQEIMERLSRDTEGRTILFEGRPIRYVQHIETVALKAF